VRATSPSDSAREALLQTGRIKLIQTLWAIEVLQPVLAEVAEVRAVELGVLKDGRRRERDEHLPAVSRRHDASGAVHAEAVVALVGRARLGGVYAHSDPHVAFFRPVVRRERALRVDRRLRGLVRAPEGKEERVALVVDLLAAVILRRRAKDPPMLSKELAVPSTKPFQELGRSLYVSEEEGEGSRGETRRAHRIKALYRSAGSSTARQRQVRRQRRSGRFLLAHRRRRTTVAITPAFRAVGLRIAVTRSMAETTAVDAPDVRFAKSGDISIAYATVGDGPFDLVFVNGWVLSALEYAWEGPAADFFRELASFSRLILFDKRGTGLSDRAAGIPDLETRMDDIRAVMDAAGSKRAAIMGFSEGGPMTLLSQRAIPSERRRPSFTAAGPPTLQTTITRGGSRPRNGRKASERRERQRARTSGWTIGSKPSPQTR